jgi:hypothetical protein
MPYYSNKKKSVFDNDGLKKGVIILLVVSFVGFGIADVWKGHSETQNCIVQDKWDEYDYDDGWTYYYVEVLTDEGFDYTVKVSSGAFESTHSGQERKLVINRGGITGMAWSTALQ